MRDFNFFMWLAEKLHVEGYLDEWNLSVLGSLFVMLILFAISLLVWRRLRVPEKVVIPSGKLNLQNIFELFVEKSLGIMQGIMGDRAEKFFPLIGTLFIYIFACNLLGFIPGFVSPTTVITTNFACAIVVFVYYNYVGIRERGFFSYIRNFAGPVAWLAPLFIVVELVSHLVRPISLSVRLYGNMVGEEMVQGIFSSLIPVFVPIFFIILGIFISFIQAFIFAILSMVYIALAVEYE